MGNFAKFGRRFPAIHFWDQFLRRNEEHSLRIGQFSVQLCAENQCKWATLMEFVNNFTIKWAFHTVFTSRFVWDWTLRSYQESIFVKNPIGLVLHSCPNIVNSFDHIQTSAAEVCIFLRTIFSHFPDEAVWPETSNLLLYLHKLRHL